MRHQQSDSAAPQPSCFSSNNPLSQTGDDVRNPRYIEREQPPGDKASWARIPYRLSDPDGGCKVELERLGQPLQTEIETCAEFGAISHAVMVHSNRIPSIPLGNNSPPAMAIPPPPPPPRMMLEAIQPPTMAPSVPTTERRGNSSARPPFDPAPKTGGEQLISQRPRSPSCLTTAFTSDGVTFPSAKADGEAVIMNAFSSGSSEERVTPPKGPTPPVTHNSLVSSALSDSAACVGTRVSSVDPRRPWRQTAAIRHCYRPGSLSVDPSNSGHLHSDKGVYGAISGATSQTVPVPIEVNAGAPSEPLQDSSRSGLRVSLSSFTSETPLITVRRFLSPDWQDNDGMRAGWSLLSLPPSTRTGPSTVSPATTSTLPEPAALNSGSSAPKPLPPCFPAGKLVSQQRRLSDRHLSEHTARTPQSAEDDALTTVVVPYASHSGSSSFLCSCGGFGQRTSRTPPVAVLVPLAPVLKGRAPAPRSTSPLSLQTLESDTCRVNADSLTSEVNLCPLHSDTSRSHYQEPPGFVEGRVSGRVSPIHTSLSHLYSPPSTRQLTPARSSAPRHRDPTLLDYVANLKPPCGSSSIRGSLLCVGGALCTVPFCAVVSILSLHYWAITFEETGYTTEALRTHTESMLTPNLKLALGILLAFVVMGGGSSVVLYLGLYCSAIRHQLRAFALCVRLAGAWLSSDVHHPSAGNAGFRCESVIPLDVTVAAAQQLANDKIFSHRLSPFVIRWHEEINRLVNHLTRPIEVSQAEWCSYLASERRSNVPRHENANVSCDRSAIATVADGDIFCDTNRALSSAVQSSVPVVENEALSLPGPQPGLRYRMNEAVFSRRPQHPMAMSKRQEAVTVVVCRLIDPTDLLTNQTPLTRVQLEELQHLSNDFHRRLRAVPRTPHAAITEVGVSEMVFSFNTVSPLPSLVASPAAVALAVAARNALMEWQPKYRGAPVHWGISVHRFDAYMCPTRGMQGRLYISYGTVEYNFSRLLAELAAVLDYGVLCHAGFLADASCESQSLPVDCVMDLGQQPFVVYQLQDREIEKEHRLQMNSAIMVMRNGDYKAAVEALDLWMRRSDGCSGLPKAAAHLRYVASFLERSARQRRMHALEAKPVPGSAPSFAHPIEGIAEWAAEGLLMSYSRPPPVWEEEEGQTQMAPRLSSPDLRCTSSIMAKGKGSSGRFRTRKCWSSNVLVPPLALQSRGNTREMADFLRGLPHRRPSFRISHISSAQQEDRQVERRESDTVLCHTQDGCLATEENTDLLCSSHKSNKHLSFVSGFVSRGGNVLGAGSQPLSSHNDIAGASTLSPATRPVFQMPIPTSALNDVGGERMWAALAILTESDHSILTATGPKPHLFSNSWSFAESGVHEAPTPTPLTSAVLAPSQLDMRRQRHASSTHPSVKTDDDVQLPAAFVCAPPQGSAAAPSLQRWRHDGGSGKGDRPPCENDSPLLAEVQSYYEVWPQQLPGTQINSESMNTTITHLPSEVSHESASALSSSARRQASASTAIAASAVLPLFVESRIPLVASERPEARSEADFFSDADVTQEPSMISVAQRSRSRLSQRATAQPSSVVCSQTIRIDASFSDAVKVFQGFHPDGYLVAVKRVSRHAQKQIALLRNEVDVLRELHHRNIVNIVSAWSDDEAEYFAMEYACETLASVLQKFKVLLPGIVRFYARELLSALTYLHREYGIIHRDLSPNNVIITNTTDRSRVKLIDFGRAVIIPLFCSGSSGLSVTAPGSTSLEFTERRLNNSASSATDVVMSVVGTPLFMSPQACKGIVHPANDVWGLGVIVHLCLTGSYPYPSETFTDPETFIENVGSGRLTPVLAESCVMTEEAYSFVEQCLMLDHTERPSAATLLKHSFVEP